MQSRLETILMTSVSTYIMMAFGWLLTPIFDASKKLWHDIKILFFDNLEEIDGYDDNQLSMLGLDVGSINDNDRYWDYSTRNRRR